MTGCLAQQLEMLGYELSLDGENLHFRYTRLGDPPERAATLLEKVRQHKAEVLDYLRVIETPQAKLEKPLLIESGYLKDTFYLVANESQAGEIEQAGSVCHLPAEVRILLTNSTGMNEAALRDYLNKIHEVKRVFAGARIKGV